MQRKKSLMGGVLLIAGGMLTLASAATATLDDYYRLKKSDPVRAEQTLASYINENPRDVTARLEMAYRLIDRKKPAAAAEHLEAARAVEPENEKIRLQLAYVYQQMGKNALAQREFSSLGTSDACEALANNASRRWEFFPRPYFADVYLNPVYQSRFSNSIVYSQARAGVSFSEPRPYEIYASIRYADDSETKSGTSPDVFSDNAAIFAGGFRVFPFKRVPLSMYAEAGRAYDVVNRNRDRWREDFRGGLSYYDTWAPTAQCGPAWRFPLKRSSSLYADGSFYSRYDDNWIAYVQWREGLRVVEKSRAALDVHLYFGGAVDTDQVYYNNVAEYGVGATLVPDHAWPLLFRYTVVRGSYLHVSSPVSNPHPNDYTDHRWELVGYLRF